MIDITSTRQSRDIPPTHIYVKSLGKNDPCLSIHLNPLVFSTCVPYEIIFVRTKKTDRILLIDLMQF